MSRRRSPYAAYLHADLFPDLRANSANAVAARVANAVNVSDTELLERPAETDTGEPEVAHIGRRDDVTRAYVTGEAIKALCGVVFVPTRDPSRYPVCQACSRVLKGIQAGRGGAN